MDIFDIRQFSGSGPYVSYAVYMGARQISVHGTEHEAKKAKAGYAKVWAIAKDRE